MKGIDWSKLAPLMSPKPEAPPSSISKEEILKLLYNASFPKKTLEPGITGQKIKQIWVDEIAQFDAQGITKTKGALWPSPPQTTTNPCSEIEMAPAEPKAKEFPQDVLQIILALEKIINDQNEKMAQMAERMEHLEQRMNSFNPNHGRF